MPACLLQGSFKGYDLHTNIILASAVERLFSVDEPVEMVPLGLYMIRGDNM
jgi:U6 snRNA-associated Sm-like protein LSm8